MRLPCGRSVSQYNNAEGNYSGNYFLNFIYNLSKLKLNLSSRINYAISRNVNLVNSQMNRSLSHAFMIDFSANYHRTQFFDFSSTSSLAYSLIQYDYRKERNNTFPSYVQSTSVNVRPTARMKINGEFFWLLRRRVMEGDVDNNIVKLNLSISYSVLKSRSLQFSAVVNDLFNQNAGFRRSINNSFITSQQYLTVRRYLLLSVYWNFSRTTR
jgi:hypothetical protein